MDENEEFYPRRIGFYYSGAFIPNIIKIDLMDHIKNNGEKYCEIELESINMVFDKENKKLQVDYDYFSNLYKKLINLNFNEILIKAGAYGLDGTSLEVYLEHGHNYLQFHIWCHDLNIENRSLTEINDIFNELLEKFDINKELINYA